MNTLQTFIQQTSVVLVNLIFFLVVIRPRRFSRIITGVITSTVFIMTALPHFLFPSFFSDGAAAGPEGLAFHFIYWIMSMFIQYALLFILLKRDWLRNILLYVIWDIIMTLILSLCVVALHILLPQIRPQGAMSLLCTVPSAIPAALILRLPRLQAMKLPGAFCIVTVFIYSIGRLVNTLSLFRFAKGEWQKLVVYPVLLLAFILSLAILSAYFGLNLYITGKCRDMENTYGKQNSKAKTGVHRLLQKINDSCRFQHIEFDSQTSLDEVSPEAEGRILYMMQILFSLSQEHTGKQSDKIFFTVQECRGFLLLSSRATYRNAPKGLGENLLSILRDTFLQIQFNRMVKNSRGRVQYLDGGPFSKDIRVILPLPLRAGARDFHASAPLHQPKKTL